MIDESTKNYLIEDGWKYEIRPDGIGSREVFIRDWYWGYILELSRVVGSPLWFGGFLSPGRVTSLIASIVGEDSIFRALLELLDNVKTHFSDLIKSAERLKTQTLGVLPKQVHIMSHGYLLCHLVDAPSKLPEGHKWIPHWAALDGIRSVNEKHLPPDDALCPECMCILSDIRGRERIWHKVGNEKNQIY